MTATNTVPAPAVTVSAVSQLAGKVVHLALNLVSTLAILRYLAPEAYGSYVLVVTMVTLVGVVADFGLPKLAVREIALSDSDGLGARNEILGTLVVLRLVLAVVAIVGCQVLLALFAQPTLVHQAAAIASLTLLVDAVLGIIMVCFQVHLVQQYEAVVRVAAEGLETGLVLLLIALHVSFLGLFVPPIVGLVVGLGLAFALGRRFQLRLTPVRHRLARLVREALPVGPALLISVAYVKVGTLVLSALRPPADVGIYGSAHQPIEYLFLGSAVIINVIFPLLAQAFGRGQLDHFAALYQRGTELLLIVTLLVPVLLAFLAPAIVAVAFGGAYRAAGDPLRLLAVALVLMTLNAWQALALFIGGFQRLNLICNAAALGLAVVVSVLLTSRFGPIGAAVAAVVTAAAVWAASVTLVRQRLGASPDLVRLAQILGVAAGTALVLAGLTAAGSPWVLSLLLGCAVYALALQRLGFGRTLRKAFIG